MSSRDDKKAARKAKKEKQKAILEGVELEEAKPQKKEAHRGEYHDVCFNAERPCVVRDDLVGMLAMQVKLFFLVFLI